MEGAEVEATAEVVEAALTAEAVVVGRVAVALTQAVRTDARISGKKARSKFGAGFFGLTRSV
jgi:hypothetical protein